MKLSPYPRLRKVVFEKFVEKEENTDIWHFVIFPQCFLPFWKINKPFKACFICSLSNALNLAYSEVLSSGEKGFIMLW